MPGFPFGILPQLKNQAAFQSLAVRPKSEPYLAKQGLCGQEKRKKFVFWTVKKSQRILLRLEEFLGIFRIRKSGIFIIYANEFFGAK